MTSQENQRIAVFDVDGTLLRGDCLWLAARRAKSSWGQVVAVLACLPWLISWQLRLVSTGRFKQQVIAAFGICEAVNRAEAAGRADWLLDDLKAQINPEALQRLHWHQQQGVRVLLCSASPRLLLQPLADWLKVELLCTELEQRDGLWRPLLAGANCKGPEKVRRLEDHLGPLKGRLIEAYGDSKGDRELLKAAAIPHYRSFLAEPTPYPAFSLGPLLLASRPNSRRLLQARWQRFRHHFPSGSLARGLLPASLISVLVWANEALVLWLLVRLLAPAPITIPTAINIYLLSGTAGMASSLPGGIGVNEAATVLLLGQQGVPAAVALTVAVLRRLITLWSMVALAAAIGVLPLPVGEPGRRNYPP